MINTFYPHLLPDEHISSMFARRLQLNATRPFKYEQRALTGVSNSIGLLHLSTPILSLVLNSTASEQGRERILKENTLCGFYSHSLRRKWIEAYLNDFPKIGRRDLFVPQCSKLRSASQWRWCLQCIDRDISEHGVAYWHVEHQLPTSMTCFKHLDEQLISACASCGFSINDLKLVNGPPKHCPSCKQVFISGSKVLTNELLWIQSMGQKLHSNDGSLLEQKYAYDMNYALALLVSRNKGCRLKEPWVVQELHQRAFSNWAKESGFSALFADGFSFEKDRAVGLADTIIKNRKVSPLSHLLWLRYFGFESFGDVQ